MNYELVPLGLPTVFKRALAVVGHERLLFARIHLSFRAAGTKRSFIRRSMRWWKSA